MIPPAANQTIIRFGYPATLIADYPNWVVLLRPDQPTLASLVLAARSEVTAFSALPPAAFTELASVITDIEAALHVAVKPEKFNYLMLMMVDPHVHFHVIPRYEGERAAEGVSIVDTGWPRTPALGEALALTTAQIDALATWLKRIWPARSH